MANELTRDMVEKVIKQYRISHNCLTNKRCSITCNHKITLASGSRDCSALRLDQALADYERAGERLSETYFRAKAEIK
jgi:hypothetical protein